MIDVYNIMLVASLAQKWECYNCNEEVEGGICHTCDCTFTEYLLSKDVKLSDLGVRLR